MKERLPAVHWSATVGGTAACGKRNGAVIGIDAAQVTCGNCKRRMPKPVEVVEFVATFHDNPNIDACPECLPAVAAILDANPDKEPAELELPRCDFCDDLRLVYVQPPHADPSSP